MMARHRVPVARWVRGSILLEVVVSIAIFVTVGMTILSVIGQGEAALRETRARQRAVDLARSAVAAIEAGLATPQSVGTLARSPAGSAAWLELDADAAEGAASNSLADDTLELEADVEPTADVGLSLLTVRVSPKQAGSATSAALVELRQLVRVVPWRSPADRSGGDR